MPPQIARQFRRVDTNNDFLISFDEMAILAKAYQDKVNVKEDESSKWLKVTKKHHLQQHKRKKLKQKNQLIFSKLYPY